MDRRASLGAASRPRLPQRAVSGGPHAHSHSHSVSNSAAKRPTLPARFSTIAAAAAAPSSAPFVDLTLDGPVAEMNDVEAFSGSSELVKSPEVVSLDGSEDASPPTKRAKISGPAFQAGGGDGGADGGDAAHTIHPGSPLPPPPSVPSLRTRLGARRRHRFGIEPATRKSHSLDPPAIATRIPAPKKAADFSAWTGSHPEDVLNENLIKAGYFDKSAGANQAECNSAKTTIFSTLNQKNSHGLTLLGYLFTTVLEKRQTMGKCTAAPTFKPPPRVTVTDTKREAWLRDLATPEVPLRKQSRTIPHGIRGKLLMEQCLAKDVPLHRATWLAKCVGANELRAFRRKGVSGSAAASGEAKWVREWTVHVEQFFEDVIAACGQGNWKQKMNYAIKLGAAFYSEKLLDQNHFLDWIVSSFLAADLARVHIWIVLVQLYWEDITLYGRRGRMLAEGILHHLDQITKAGQIAHTALGTLLQKLLLVLATTNQGCVILLRTWETYKHLLSTGSITSPAPSSFDRVIKRNEFLVQPLLRNVAGPRSTTFELLSELDAVELDVDVAHLANTGLNTVPDTIQLIRVLLDWAATPYRTGLSRIYLAANLTAHLHKTGYDTDLAILNYLENSQSLSQLSVAYIHRMVVELVQLQAFSIGRYMQWLITSGVLAFRQEPSCATSLLAALPIADLPPFVLNTRRTLMRRLGYPPQEVDLSDELLTQIDMAESTQSGQFETLLESLQSLNISARFDVCRRLCDKISIQTKDGGIALEEFCVARTVIEHAEDMRSLATLLQSAITSDNTALLATTCDSINLHAESFAATGKLSPLVDSIAERYISLRSSQILDRALILALQSVAARFPAKANLVKLLARDLTICEQQNSFAVCSPASDSVIGMHASTLDSDEDLDAVFASGNTMDEQLMQRVFSHIMQRTSKSGLDGMEAVRRASGWLDQLRSVDSSGVFDALLQDYVRSVVHGNTDPDSWAVGIVNIVSSGAVPLAPVAQLADTVDSPQLAIRMLSILLSARSAELGRYELEGYRYHLQQERCKDEHLVQIVKLIRTACGSPSFTATDPELLTFVIRAINRMSSSAAYLSADADPSEISRTNWGRIITAILLRGSELPRDAKELTIPDLIGLVTPLSTPFCVEALRYYRLSPRWNDGNEGVFADALLEAFDNNLDAWPQLLELAGDSVNNRIRDWAQDQILLTPASPTTDNADATLARAERCLELLAVATKLVTNHDDSMMLGAVTERLKGSESELSGLDDARSENHQQTDWSLRSLHILLQLTAMAIQSSSNDGEASQPVKAQLLHVLCSLIIVPRLQLSQELWEHLLDVASALADSLSEASLAVAKQHCSSTILADRRVQFILGTTSDLSDTSLMLASYAQPLGSQQQRLLNRTASQPNVGGRLGMAGQVQHHRIPSQSAIAMSRQDSRMAAETKTTPFAVRQWEIIPDSAPIMGDNDGSLSLRLFSARKV